MTAILGKVILYQIIFLLIIHNFSKTGKQNVGYFESSQKTQIYAAEQSGEIIDCRRCLL